MTSDDSFGSLTPRQGWCTVPEKAKYHEVVSEEFLAGLEEVGRTAKGEVIYNCPWCEERYGPRPDRKYHKLYYNPAKGVGFCFRCGTSLSIISSGISLSEATTVLPSLSIPHKDTAEPSPISDIFLALPISKNRELAKYYLLQRSPYLQEVIPKYGITYYQASFGNGLYGVVFPFYFQGKLVSYQVRYFRLDGKPLSERYETRPGPKVPYSPFGFSYKGPVDRIALVEGIFGTFGLLYLSDHLNLFARELSSVGLSLNELQEALRNPIATLGYNISESVFWAIKSLAPLHVVVVMDERSLSYQSVVRLLQDLTSVERVDVLNIGDPDEYATRLFLHLSSLTEDTA